MHRSPCLSAGAFASFLVPTHQGGPILNQNPSSCDYTDTAISDENLVRQIAAGDSRALEALYARYSAPLYRYLFRLVHETTEAEDLLQEVFVAAWRGASRFKGRAQVRTWIFRIAHNQAISWLRRQRATLALDGVEGRLAASDPAEQTMERWRAEQVRRALPGLPAKHRAVLELTFYHGFSQAEIAEIVGCPVGTVKSRMSYARRYLRQALSGLDLEG